VGAAEDGVGAWAVRTASGPLRMRGDIFAAARRWRIRVLPTGNLASLTSRRRGSGTGRGYDGVGTGSGVDVPRTALGGRTHRLCLDSARIRGGGGCCDGSDERDERRGGRRRGHPPVVDGRRRGTGCRNCPAHRPRRSDPR